MAMASAVYEREASTDAFWDEFAKGVVIDREDLPPKIAAHFETKKVRMIEEGGKVVLSPIDAEYQLALIDMACDRFAGRGWSSYEFMANKKFEKELEG